jgi:hypothetical protein
MQMREAVVLFLAHPDVRDVAVLAIDRRTERVPAFGQVAVLEVLIARSRRRVKREREQAAQIRVRSTNALDLLDEVLAHSVATTVAVPGVAPEVRAVALLVDKLEVRVDPSAVISVVIVSLRAR